MIRLLGWIYALLGGAGLLVGAALTIGMWMEGPTAREAFAWTLVIFVIVLIFYLLPCFLGGVGLLLRQGWGRVAAAIASVLLLITFPIGTLLGAFGLWVLFGSRAARDQWPSRDPSPSSTVR